MIVAPLVVDPAHDLPLVGYISVAVCDLAARIRLRVLRKNSIYDVQRRLIVKGGIDLIVDEGGLQRDLPAGVADG